MSYEDEYSWQMPGDEMFAVPSPFVPTPIMTSPREMASQLWSPAHLEFDDPDYDQVEAMRAALYERRQQPQLMISPTYSRQSVPVQGPTYTYPTQQPISAVVNHPMVMKQQPMMMMPQPMMRGGGYAMQFQPMQAMPVMGMKKKRRRRKKYV